MLVEVALAGDGPLTADVEHAQRPHLARIRYTDRHPVLLLYGGIGGGRLHAAELDRQRLGWIAGPEIPLCLSGRLVLAVVRQTVRYVLLRDEAVAGAVIGVRPLDVSFDQSAA